ncbi:MAG: CRISPR-associated endonuclease Cas2 [bacterium]
MMFIVISYDVLDDKRWLKISKILESYGKRVQFSVFECNLTQSQLIKLQERIKKVVVTKEDSVRFYELCEKCLTRVATIGNIPITTDPEYFLV